MGNVFDIKRFINEIEIRPEIWHKKLKITREQQENAWDRIGQNLFANWKLCPMETRADRG